tara:strand:- start:888 stop:1508 length:621 start_codon:yes stop_codon:yes gene_type:complete
MKKFLSAFYGLFLVTGIFAQQCDLEMLNMDWDDQTITLTLTDNVCSNSSTPSWVPYPDSVYAVQLGLSYGGTTCIIPSNSTNFYPPLGLNDTITYSFSDWTDPFSCFDNAFTYYQETCMATVSVVGPNNSINLDMNNGNNYIGFNPVWDNCYDVVNVTELVNVNNEVIGVFDLLGRYIQKDIIGLEPGELYLIKYNDGTITKLLFN